MSVILRPMPQVRAPRIVVGTTLRKRAPVLAAHLRTLAWQEWPDRCTPEFVFVDDGLDEEARGVLRAFVDEYGGTVLPATPIPGEFSDQRQDTHHWSHGAMARVGQNKNLIIRHAIDQRADAVWFCDADLLLDRTTFTSLWAADAPITCAVYWTVWHQGPAPVPLQAAPQVWLRHPYQLDGRGYDAAEFRRALVQRQRVQVWGQGACTLIRTEVLEKGVSFDYVPGVSLEGMMAGEDRHFCLRAEGLHVPMYADAWPDIFHVYHPEDESHIPAMLDRLGASHPTTVGAGDLVSLVVEPLEPVPVSATEAHLIPAQHIRGQMGRLRLLPELEDAIAQMRRGDVRIVPVNFPSHYPLAVVRGERRLLRVTLVDVKPWGFPPVLEQEFLVSDLAAGVHADRTTLTERQQAA